MTKTKQDNDMTNHIGLVHTKIKMELSGPIQQDTICDENQTRQDVTDHTDAIYVENEIEL